MNLFELVFLIFFFRYIPITGVEWLDHVVVILLVFFRNLHTVFQGFPTSSDGKESVCSVGDLG